MLRMVFVSMHVELSLQYHTLRRGIAKIVVYNWPSQRQAFPYSPQTEDYPAGCVAQGAMAEFEVVIRKKLRNDLARLSGHPRRLGHKLVGSSLDRDL